MLLTLRVLLREAYRVAAINEAVEKWLDHKIVVGALQSVLCSVTYLLRALKPKPIPKATQPFQYALGIVDEAG